MLKESRFYTPLPDNRVECTSCAQRCVIEDGGVGYCGVRKNIGGKLYQLNYGKIVTLREVSSMTELPFLPAEKMLVIGMLGNNLKITFDPDWDRSQFPVWAQKEYGRELTNEMIQKVGFEMSHEEIIKYCKDHEVAAVLFAQSEPIVNLDYILELSSALRGAGLKIYWQSNGYFNREIVKEIVPLVDLVCVSYHSTQRYFWKKHCKVTLSVIHENLMQMKTSGIPLVIATTLIPEENDSAKEIERLANFVHNLGYPGNSVPWLIRRFKPEYRILDKPITSMEKLEEAVRIAKSVGLTNVHLVGL